MEFSLVFIFVAISVFFQMSLVTSDYVIPVPGDCTKYQVCDYSGCFVFNCGIGTEFNPRILVCDYPLRDRGACGIRDYNIGPTIPYPGRAISSYPTSPGYPGNSGYPGAVGPNPSPGYPGSGSPNPSPGYPGAGSPNPSPGYPGAGSPNPSPGYPGAGSPNPGYPGSGGQNPSPPIQGCPAYCG